MSLQERFANEPSIAVQIAVRLAVVLIASIVLSPIFINDIAHYWDVGRVVDWNTLPYRDFLWEFPPLTTVILLLIPLSGGSNPVFSALFVALVVAFEILTWRVVRSMMDGVARAHANWLWLATLVPLSSIAYFRLDWPAVLFGAIALKGILSNKVRPTVLGILGGFAVKLWTVVFVGILIGQKRFKQAAIAVSLCAAATVGWYLFSPAGLESFFEYRKGSGFQIESIPGSLIMLFGEHNSYFQYGALMVSDAGWGWLQLALPALFVLTAGACVVAMWLKPVDVVALSGALVLMLLLTSRLLSPQYLVWMAPFVVLLFKAHKGQAILFAIASWLTIIEMQLYKNVVAGEVFATMLVTLRNVALVIMLVQLLRLAFARQSSLTSS